MRGQGISAGIKRTAGLLLAVLGGAVLSGCDPTAEIRKPELATCQRYLRSAQRVPSSFRRTWYNVADYPLSRAQLAVATGNKAQADAAPDPALRRIFINYSASDGLGATVDGSGVCFFAMTDGAAGTYAEDIESQVDKVVVDNEQRVLSMSMGDQNVIARGCCTTPAFDPKVLDGVQPQRRGTVKAEGRKL